MPRNASGTYSLPSGNPVSSGTLIDSNWANNTLNDLANEITDSLSRSAEGGMLAPLRLTDGVQATPSLAFTNEPSTGLYRAGTNEAWFVTGGNQVAKFTSTGMDGRFAAGAAATPSLAAYNDVNTGLWFPAADTLAASTGGSERLRVDSSGNVGIGTASPGQKLDVIGSGRSTGAWAVGDSSGNFSGSMSNESDTSKSVTFAADPGNAGANSFMRFNVDGSERMRLDASGNLGIGTASPSVKFEVRNDVAAATSLAATTIKLYNNSDGGAGIEFGNAVFGKSKISFGVESTGGGTDDTFLAFSTCLNAGALTERMRIDASGNLGIGTASPVGRADVVSNATAAFVARASTAGANQTVQALNAYNSDASLFALAKYNAVQHIWGYAGATEGMRLDSSGNLGIGTASPGARLDVRDALGTILGQFFENSSGQNRRIRFSIASNVCVLETGASTGSTNLAFTVDGSERMRLDASGNLGIGTASPGSLLDVVGTATGSGIAASVRNNATTGNSLAVYRLFAHDGSTVANGGSVFLSANSWAYQQIAANQLNVYGVKAGGIRLATANSGPIIFAPTTGADADFATEAMRITPAGNIVAGASAALATTATNGFLYVPTCAGVPTGTPTAVTGMVPIVVDTTNNRWYFYSGGAWRNAGP